MSDKKNDGRSSDSPSTDKAPEKEIDWSDPSVPVGNAPPMPVWPVVLGGIAWVGWVVFLIVMALTRSVAAVM